MTHDIQFSNMTVPTETYMADKYVHVFLGAFIEAPKSSW